MTREVKVLEDADAVARDAAAEVIRAADLAIKARGRFTLVLAGGSTPAALYGHLAALPPGVMPWSQTLLFWGDERCVPPDHEWSNYRMVRGTLLDRIAVPPGNVHRMHGEDDPAAAAAAYEQVMAAAFREEPPVFDLVLLGIGDDGHTASLFPGMPALAVRGSSVVATGVPAYVRPQIPRLTLTFPVLNSARHVVFLATGNSKAKAVAQALRGENSGAESVPAARIVEAKRVTWLLDQNAATLLYEEWAGDGTTG